MKILLTGATGFIGLAVLRALLLRGDTVLACSRQADFGKVFNEPILSKDSVAMLSRGNYADCAPLSRLLQRAPHSVYELLNTPATTAERWYADLYFFKLLLCWVIAFVWLWSGITSLFFIRSRIVWHC